MHKRWILPEVDLSHDGGDPDWHVFGGTTTPLFTEDWKIKCWRWNGLQPGHYAEYWRLCIVDDWRLTVRAYERDPQNVHHAWQYVDRHPVFWQFDGNLHEGYPENHVTNLTYERQWGRGWPEITPHMVCPATDQIEDNRRLNTAVRWWYELGPRNLHRDEHGWLGCSHDTALDGGAATYELAVCEVALKIWENYGNDRRVVDA